MPNQGVCEGPGVMPSRWVCAYFLHYVLNHSACLPEFLGNLRVGVLHRNPSIPSKVARATWHDLASVPPSHPPRLLD